MDYAQPTVAGKMSIIGLDHLALSFRALSPEAHRYRFSHKCIPAVWKARVNFLLALGLSFAGMNDWTSHRNEIEPQPWL